jgi:hypothetical protein
VRVLVAARGGHAFPPRLIEQDGSIISLPEGPDEIIQAQYVDSTKINFQ